MRTTISSVSSRSSPRSSITTSCRVFQSIQHLPLHSNFVHLLIESLYTQVHFGKIMFQVFLGENYYTDRTLKQTVDVLRRRDKTLQSQIHSLKAEIDDFQTEASFFANTSSEAAEFLRLEKSIKKKKKILELCFSQYAEESELDVVNGLGDKTNGNRIGYEEFVLEKPQYLKKEDQSRGGIPQQNAETLRDFQATSRGKASSSVVGPQKIESPIQKLESKFDTNKCRLLLDRS
ncbi:uncharacterized protein LOC106379647 isoform X2 [Brassica napus]|uniref:uncharacterized protein LOC106379647 isoform X2 n=1 Tax=Brassica napus TaxID=3708 RepID=UPI000BBED278|nr:uncharacterized protein LOC106379647 isoform X2 [Brassica napus]